MRIVAASSDYVDDDYFGRAEESELRSVRLGADSARNDEVDSVFFERAGFKSFAESVERDESSVEGKPHLAAVSMAGQHQIRGCVPSFGKTFRVMI